MKLIASAVAITLLGISVYTGIDLPWHMRKAELRWQMPANTNGISFNIRRYNTLNTAIRACRLLTNTMSTTVTMTIPDNAMVGVYVTNNITGEEYVDNSVCPVSVIMKE